MATEKTMNIRANLNLINGGELDGIVKYDNSESGLSATDVKAAIDELKSQIDSIQQSSSVKHWERFGLKEGSGSTTITVPNLLDYAEVMIVCGVSGSSRRNLASTTIPIERFLDYTTDHGNGAHQAYYSATYNAGVSYIGNNRVKLYATSSSACLFYGR